MYVNSSPTINITQSLCASAFEAGHVKRLYVLRHKLFIVKVGGIKKVFRTFAAK